MLEKEFGAPEQDHLLGHMSYRRVVSKPHQFQLCPP